MIGFAPANNPQIAVAVVVPEQNVGSDGAGVAGPIMKAVMEPAIPQGLGRPAVYGGAGPGDGICRRGGR